MFTELFLLTHPICDPPIPSLAREGSALNFSSEKIRDEGWVLILLSKYRRLSKLEGINTTFNLKIFHVVDIYKEG